MSLRMQFPELEEKFKKPDTPRGMTKEIEFKFFKEKKPILVPSSRSLSQSPINPLFVEPRDIEVKSSGCRCTIM